MYIPERVRVQWCVLLRYSELPAYECPHVCNVHFSYAVFRVHFVSVDALHSTIQDSAKLKRILVYLNGTMDQTLVLGTHDNALMRTWVNASYAIHNDTKSNSGGVKDTRYPFESVKETKIEHQKLHRIGVSGG